MYKFLSSGTIMTISLSGLCRDGHARMKPELVKYIGIRLCIHETLYIYIYTRICICICI